MNETSWELMRSICEGRTPLPTAEGVQRSIDQVQTESKLELMTKQLLARSGQASLEIMPAQLHSGKKEKRGRRGATVQ